MSVINNIERLVIGGAVSGVAFQITTGITAKLCSTGNVPSPLTGKPESYAAASFTPSMPSSWLTFLP